MAVRSARAALSGE